MASPKLSPKRPKKAFVQFVIAAVVAVVVGAAAIGLTVMLISGVSSSARQQKAEALKQAEEAQAELERLRKEKEAKAEKFEIVAAVDIPMEAVITADMLEVKKLAKGQLPNRDGYRQPGQVIGQVSAMKVLKGESITKNKLILGGNNLPIPDGMRAMTIGVSDISSLNGALFVGSYVDVLVTVTLDDLPVTKTLVQRKRVLDIGDPKAGSSSSRRSEGTRTAQTVTLAVTPGEAELLALATQKGQFHLTLRSFRDKNNVAVPGADIEYLVTGYNRGALSKKRLHQQADDWQTPPASMPEAMLPDPNTPAASSGGGFTMEIIKAGSVETKVFGQ